MKISDQRMRLVLAYCLHFSCRLFAVEEQTGESVILPGSGERIPSLEQRLSPSIDQDQSEDEYGPALPPAIPALPNTGKFRSLVI